jgi:hypothetical protein
MPRRAKPAGDSGTLSLSSLRNQKMPGLTAEQGGVMAQAGSVCLDDQGHGTVATLIVEDTRGAFASPQLLRRLPVRDELKNAYAFETRATDHGACGVALLLILRFTDLKVLEESRQTTGYDYWLGRDPDHAFRDGVMLEVSGIRHGEASDINARVKEKMDRLRKYPDNAGPGYIIVVEFSRPVARVMHL